MYLLCEKLGSKYKPTLLDLILLLQMNWNCDFREKLGGEQNRAEGEKLHWGRGEGRGRVFGYLK